MSTTASTSEPRTSSAGRSAVESNREQADRKQITVTLEDLPSSSQALSRRASIGWAAASGLLMLGSFTPVDFGPLGWVALIPLLWLATRVEKPSSLYKAALIGGLVWTVPQLQWLRLASWPMYFACAALAFYVALYFPAFVALVRTAVLRLSIPLPIAAGVCWVGLEYLRSHLMTGFPWYLLGHTQHRWTALTQVADLGGASVVSLLMASFAGLCVLVWDRRSSGASAAVPVVAWSVLFAGALGYGHWRVGSAEFKPGPRVALVQGNFPSEMKHDPTLHKRIFDAHNRLTLAATAEQPDVIVWPETMYPYPLQLADDGVTDEQLQQLTGSRMTVAQFENNGVPEVMKATAMRSGATLVLGVGRFIADAEGVDFANSAVLVDPDVGVATAYDKVHRVVFGEYVPFTEQLPFLKFLEFLTPVRKGEGPKVFEAADAKLIPLICFEDTVPAVAKNAVNEARADDSNDDGAVLVNLTNDGWFRGSSEHDQHLITARFRSIETRTPMVRAVNMGISAVIDGNGVVVEPDKFLDATRTVDAEAYEPPVESTMTDDVGRYRKSLSAVVVSGVPLDGRASPFLSIGESFPLLCFAVVCVVGVIGWRDGRRLVENG